MAKLLTKEELTQKLELLKYSLQYCHRQIPNHIVFFNQKSYYFYITKFSALDQTTPCTIEELIQDITPYIPFSLTNGSFSLFLEAVGQKHPEDMEALRLEFIENTRAEFIHLILHAKGTYWQDIEKACQRIRRYQETLVNLPV